MVVDTMVFAYALLASATRREEATRALEHCDEIVVPDSLRPELVNAVWQYVRKAQITPDLGVELLRDAEALFDRVVSCQVIWEHALELAVDTGHPAYDTLFVALAAREGTRVVTYDEKMLHTFPHLTVHGRNVASGSQ